MMVERHYDDEALISLMESHRDASDAHLPTCEACTEKLRSVRAVTRTLRDASVWDTRPLSEEPVVSTIATLRAFADRMTDEDARADLYVRALLDGPRETWRAKLDAHPEYRTAGVVRKLIAASDHAIDTMPIDAVEITTFATEIADGLSGLSAGRLAHLRGAARRERSYALYYTGRFAEALVDADRADAQFAEGMVDEYERARVGIVRALVLRGLERWTPGLAAARDAVRVFDASGDLERLASARLAEVLMLFSLRDFASAQVILEDLEMRLRATDHAQTHARVLSNLGYVHWQQGRMAEALNFYDASSEIQSKIGIETEALRNRWVVAAMLMDGGYPAEALVRLRAITVEFENRGMASEAASAGLAVAELLLADQKFSEVEEICRRAMRTFEMAGISYTARALTALAYIREAAQNRTATPSLVRHVRDYIRRLPAEENLLFAPP